MIGRSIAPFAIATLVLVGIVAALGAAGPNTIDDPNDVEGVLDVRTVRWRDPEGEPPAWRFVTFRGWSVRKIWDRGYLYVLVDTLGAESADYAAQMRSDGKRMLATLFKLGKGPNERDRAVSTIPVSKRNRSSITVKIPLHKMRFGKVRTFYRFWAVTTLSGEACPSICIDRAPDEGSVLRYRPGMSPTPTVSPTP